MKITGGVTHIVSPPADNPLVVGLPLVPDKPGLGLEFNPDTLSRYTVG